MNALVPLDGSELSEIVLPWAKLMADRVELLRSYLPLDNIRLTPELPMIIAEMVNDIDVDKNVGAYLKEQSQKMGDVPCAYYCAIGHPAESILLRSEKFDLVIMASHGMSGITKWLLGSVTTKVVRASCTPVLVVSARPNPKPVPAEVKTIFLPMDGSKTSETALQTGVHLAKKFQAKLILYEGVVYRDNVPEEDDWQVLSAREYLASKAAELDYDKVEILVKESPNGPEIIEQAERCQADLLVMASHGRSGVSRWLLGSVTEGVIQRSNCPVLIVYDR